MFGIMVAARRQPGSFSSGDCEFLRQLSAHVALAAQQAELHGGTASLEVSPLGGARLLLRLPGPGPRQDPVLE